MKTHFDIQLSPSHFTGEEKKYIERAIQQNQVSSFGENLVGFQKEIGTYSDNNACSLLSSGTAAIHLALILLGIEDGDEVISSSFTYSATVNPIRYQKAIPILIDSEMDTWNMSPELLEQAIQDRISKGKTPKVIILVHIYGMPSKMEELMSIASKYNIPVIEDAAEAIGARYKGKPMGSFGEMGVFSFNGNKIITTSGGGALVSNNPEYCKQATFLATQARDEAPHYQHSHIGYNYKMSNIVAGIGRGQIEVLDDRIAARRGNFEFYKNELSEFSSISFAEEPEGFYANRWLSAILTDSFETRERIRLALEKEYIESRPLWKPMHMQPIFQEFPAYVDGTSEDLFERGLCLPSGSNLSKEDLKRVVKVIKREVRIEK